MMMVVVVMVMMSPVGTLMVQPVPVVVFGIRAGPVLGTRMLPGLFRTRRRRRCVSGGGGGGDCRLGQGVQVV